MSTASPPEAFTAALSWTSAGSEVTSYEVVWQRDTSGECPDEDEGSAIFTDGSTSHVISGLFGVSYYSVTVRATNDAGTALSSELPVKTVEAGDIYMYIAVCVCVCVCLCVCVCVSVCVLSVVCVHIYNIYVCVYVQVHVLCVCCISACVCCVFVHISVCALCACVYVYVRI